MQTWIGFSRNNTGATVTENIFKMCVPIEGATLYPLSPKRDSWVD